MQKEKFAAARALTGKFASFFFLSKINLRERQKSNEAIKRKWMDMTVHNRKGREGLFSSRMKDKIQSRAGVPKITN